MKYRAISIVLFLLVISLVLTGCVKEEPPSIDVVQQYFQDNRDDIQVVVDYMLSTNYEYIVIKSDDGSIWADYEETAIHSENVQRSLKNLLNTGYFLKFKKWENTIDIMCWMAFVVEIDCGIAYTINGVDEPEIEYATEMIPLNENGWYYYVSDYEQWRVNKAGDSSLP